MKVYKTVEEACGSTIIVDNIQSVLDMAESFMSQSEDGSFNIEIVEMSEDEYENLKEFEGC